MARSLWSVEELNPGWTEVLHTARLPSPLLTSTVSTLAVVVQVAAVRMEVDLRIVPPQ